MDSGKTSECKVIGVFKSFNRVKSQDILRNPHTIRSTKSNWSFKYGIMVASALRLFLLSHLVSGETMSTLGLSDAEVRLMVRMFGRSSIPFNVVDYYLSRQNKATAFTGGNQYFNVYENARLHGLHGGN